jgi:hypothetical protein
MKFLIVPLCSLPVSSMENGRMLVYCNGEKGSCLFNKDFSNCEQRILVVKHYFYNES